MVLRNYSDIKHLKGRHNIGWGSRLVLNYVVLSLSIHIFYLSCVPYLMPSSYHQSIGSCEIGHISMPLATADTHYWQLSPVDLYDELKRERVKLF